MTTTTTTRTPASGSGTLSRRLAGPAAGAIMGAVALNAFGIWGDGTPGGEDDPWLSFLIADGFIAIGAALVFGLIVPRALRRLERTGRAGAGALILSVLALVLVLVFWSGLPPVLAAGGIVLGLAGRGAARSGLATSGLAVGLLALVADVAIYVTDWMSTNSVV